MIGEKDDRLKGGSRSDGDRRERLVAALRANLKRRKARERMIREASTDDAPEGDQPAGPEVSSRGTDAGNP